ncbi:hypothetical protein LMG28688_02791 [Paraburkholderia caffeinitolerans]|uniref:Lipoprotein n=2 Tax=Paraburkholderia caffeinitolerans TaxID=1723730 RepID=A0A6J5G334_9BURK|nr:hypothetical protein [Paraburkholderia dokdonensis]CAB3788949.1 hypothetical protein LMG28688_02791 [Paraburkholderia caffeinitolerans]
MYRLFRRFEWLAFGVVTASAIACAGFIVVERCGGVPVQRFLDALAANTSADNALACAQASQSAPCAQLQAEWKGAQ